MFEVQRKFDEDFKIGAVRIVRKTSPATGTRSAPAHARHALAETGSGAAGAPSRASSSNTQPQDGPGVLCHRRPATTTLGREGKQDHDCTCRSQARHHHLNETHRSDHLRRARMGGAGAQCAILRSGPRSRSNPRRPSRRSSPRRCGRSPRRCVDQERRGPLDPIDDGQDEYRIRGGRDGRAIDEAVARNPSDDGAAGPEM
jgi:hypothetical protein